MRTTPRIPAPAPSMKNTTNPQGAVWKMRSKPHPNPLPTASPPTSSATMRVAIPDWLGDGRAVLSSCFVWKSSSRLPRSVSLSGSGAVKIVSQKSQKTAQNRPSARSKAGGPYGRPYWVSRKTDCHKPLIFKRKSTIAHFVARDFPDGARSCGESLLSRYLLSIRQRHRDQLADAALGHGDPE